MNSLAVISLIFGIFVVIVRGGLLFSPKTSLEYYQKIVSTNTGVRIMGCVISVLGLTMAMAAWHADDPIAWIILITSLILCVVSVFIIFFPDAYRIIAESFIEDEILGVRVIGFFGVIFGVCFIIFGIWLMGSGK